MLRLARGVPGNVDARRRNAVIAYYADVAVTPRARLEAALEATVAAGREPLLDQLHQVSLIVVDKYKDIRWALWCRRAPPCCARCPCSSMRRSSGL